MNKVTKVLGYPLLMAMVVSFNAYAEDVGVDQLLLEMDSLSEEAKSVQGESNNTKDNEVAASKSVSSQESSQEATATVVEKNKKTVVDNPAAQVKKAEDGFGDFTIDKSKIEADASGSKRILRGRDPFAPSTLMVSKYQEKVDQELTKRKAEQEKRRLAQEKIDDAAKAKKDAARIAAQTEANLRAKLVQARALALPKMKLKGFIRKPNQAVLALLDISGLGTHIVRKGDTVSLGAKGTIQILEINNMSLKIKSGKVADTVVVR